MRRILRRVLLFAILVFVLWLAFWLGVYWWLTNRQRVSVGTRVPDVVGLEITQAVQKLWDRDLSFDVERRVAQVPVGYVIAQVPASGTLVAKGEPVKLIVSGGSSLTVVPDVIGKPAADVIRQLREMGLKIDDVWEKETGQHFVCIDIYPKPGTPAPLGTPVRLVVGVPHRVRVPFVVGYPLKVAEKMLADVGLKTGSVTYVYYEGTEEETVKAQFPRSGVWRWEGSKVDLEVWTGEASKTLSGNED